MVHHNIKVVWYYLSNLYKTEGGVALQLYLSPYDSYGLNC